VRFLHCRLFFLILGDFLIGLLREGALTTDFPLIFLGIGVLAIRLLVPLVSVRFSNIFCSSCS
jgi:hypothetical protein